MFRTTRRGGTVELYRSSSAGGGNDELVLGVEAQRSAGQVTVNTSSPSLSPDGKNLIYSNYGSAGSQLFLVSLSGGKPTNLFASEVSVMHATFSPQGHYIAYTSDPRGSMQVIVETFPRSDKKWTISTAGGYEPRWNIDGRQIYYLSPDGNMMSVSVEPGHVFRTPKLLFKARVVPGINAYRRHYVVSKDGRFLINASTRDFTPTPITVVLNWAADLNVS
jgi:Tol biopolymer transport system component